MLRGPSATSEQECPDFLQTAVETALVSLESHKWVSLQSSAARRQKLLKQPSTDQALKTSPGGPGKPDGPPYELMDHPPLAVLTNGVLGALNELRHCAPVSLSQRLASVLKVQHSMRIPFIDPAMR